MDVAQALRDCRADVLVSYLPVGSEQADRYYAQAAIDAGVAFVNALPVFIASDPEWARKFTEAGVPIIGDDIKSQVGATITHRVLAKLFEDRGVELLRTYQLNVGGNMDFMNMLERSRLQSKKISKTQSVTSQIPHEMERAAVHIGPSDHVPWLDDRKLAFVRLEGKAFGDVPLNLEYRLEVLAELGRRDHRCRPRRQDRVRPRDRRPGPVRRVILHEVAAGAVRRRCRPRPGRQVHPRRGRSLSTAAGSALRKPQQRNIDAHIAAPMFRCCYWPITERAGRARRAGPAGARGRGAVPAGGGARGRGGAAASAGSRGAGGRHRRLSSSWPGRPRHRVGPGDAAALDELMTW